MIPQKTRIAIISHTHPSIISKGGAEISAYTLFLGLQKLGLDPRRPRGQPRHRRRRPWRRRRLHAAPRAPTRLPAAPCRSRGRRREGPRAGVQNRPRAARYGPEVRTMQGCSRTWPCPRTRLPVLICSIFILYRVRGNPGESFPGRCAVHPCRHKAKSGMLGISASGWGHGRQHNTSGR